MVQEVAGLVAGRAPLLAGVGRGLRDAQRLAKASAEAGAAALMIHQPPDPFVSPRGILDYLNAVSDASGGLPMMLYLRNDAIGTGNIATLCALPTVKGVKWATPNPMKLAEAKAACDPAIVWEIKVLVIVAFLANAFLKFVWSHRLFGYCAVLMAATPNEPDHDAAYDTAAQAAEINIFAARSFNRGLRSVYFALAASAWLLGGGALLFAALLTFGVLWRREFASQSRKVLMRRNARDADTPS